MLTDQAARKLLGAWYTPPDLIDVVVGNVLDGFTPPAARPVRVLDPACGDGRFLAEIGSRLRSAGNAVSLTGCDVDATALRAIEDATVDRIHDDALVREWGEATYDIVIGNPPFLSQMAAVTTRGGASRHGGGPYADAAVEFLALALRLARPDGGRVGLVLPQSILGARDAAPVREEVARRAELTWSWWESRQQHFDASVNVCALGFTRSVPAPGRGRPGASWTGVITDRLGIPYLDPSWLATDGVLGDRADLNANFRDEYYALVPAVGDDADGPPLVTSGLIDPGVCLWGRRTVRFAKRRFSAPRVDLGKLVGRFPRWAERKLVPKVLVANQTRVIEAVADPGGEWLPGVPVNTVTPRPTTSPDVASGAPAVSVWEISAVLTSPVASAMAWGLTAGTGMSTTTMRVGPAVLASLAWPAGDLARAVEALQGGDVAACGHAVSVAFGLGEREIVPVLEWWMTQLPVRVSAPGRTVTTTIGLSRTLAP